MFDRARAMPRFPRGFTIPELILLVVVLSIGLAGIALALQQAARGSGDPLVSKQAVAVAEALMEEILLQPFAPVAGGASRADYNDVSDYNGYSSVGVTAIDGTPIPGLADYNVSVTVTNSAFGGAPAADAKLVTVTVTGRGVTYVLDGYRLDHGP